VAGLLLLCGLLLLPEPGPPPLAGAGRRPFAWDRQEPWAALEARFRSARASGGEDLAPAIEGARARVEDALDRLAAASLPPEAPLFETLETDLFHLAVLVASRPQHLPDLLATTARLRRLVKRQSEGWRIEERGSRERLYRLLYGSRAAVEEAMLQAPREAVPALLAGDDEPCAAPSRTIEGVLLCSGDVLVSRGGAATSALIARGNDFPGNFSHVALVHVAPLSEAPDGGAVSVVESHIESGVGVRPIEEYLAETKLRLMVLRLRSDLAPLAADPLLPHRAASSARSEAERRHVPYDFAMDYADPGKQFCSEVASAAYEPLGVTLWMGLSHLSSPGLIDWLSALGVRHFETQEPSDLEYDPQLRVVAEWRAPETLFKDHVDNAVIDVMLEAAEAGERLGHAWPLRLPARLAKGYSVVRNWAGGVGPIPEGMSASTALRVAWLKRRHAAIREGALAGVEAFRRERGYVPPYWELVRLAREARDASAPGDGQHVGEEPPQPHGEDRPGDDEP
jgi:hypothetical protein